MRLLPKRFRDCAAKRGGNLRTLLHRREGTAVALFDQHVRPSTNNAIGNSSFRPPATPLVPKRRRRRGCRARGACLRRQMDRTLSNLPESRRTESAWGRAWAPGRPGPSSGAGSPSGSDRSLGFGRGCSLCFRRAWSCHCRLLSGERRFTPSVLPLERIGPSSRGDGARWPDLHPASTSPPMSRFASRTLAAQRSRSD